MLVSQNKREAVEDGLDAKDLVVQLLEGTEPGLPGGSTAHTVTTQTHVC